MSNDGQGIALTVTASDFFEHRQYALLEHVHSLLTRDRRMPGILPPRSGKLWELGSHLFKAHPGNGTTIVLLQPVITLDGQSQLPSNNLRSLACPEQWASVESASTVSVSKAACQSRSLDPPSFSERLVVPSLNPPGSIAYRLCVSYQQQTHLDSLKA